MIVRSAVKEDWEQLMELNAQHNFPFPDFNNMLTVLVVEDEGKIIAWGYLKMLVEAVFIPAKGNKKKVVKSLKLLNDEGIRQAKRNKVEQIHSFIVDPSFKDILVKHFDYGIAKGDALILNVNTHG